MDLPSERCVLLLGFEPFGGDTVNPSQQAVARLQGWRPAPGWQVQSGVLPCVFGDALTALDALLAAHRPGLVVGVGQAAGRAELSLERVAINVDDARIADNAGRRPVDRPVVADGPAAYFATLPIKACVAALHAAGLPAGVSQTAGTFVCNHVFYGLMHRLAAAGGAVRGGFVHVPALPGQVPGAPGMALMDIEDALRLVVRTALETGDDVPLPGGALA